MKVGEEIYRGAERNCLLSNKQY